MSEKRRGYAGLDWGSESHRAFRSDDQGREAGWICFKHGGGEAMISPPVSPPELHSDEMKFISDRGERG